MGGAAYFGLALISGSKLVLSLAVIRHLANWWFLSSVEQWVTERHSILTLSYLHQNVLLSTVRTCVNYMATPCVKRQGSLRL